MTTVVGIWTPEGIILASDTLKVRVEIKGGRLIVKERSEGYRKIYSSPDGNALISYACQLGFPQHLEWLEDLVGEVMQSVPIQSIPAGFRGAVSKVLRTDELISLQEYGKSVTEFHALLAYSGKDGHRLVYQHLAHPSQEVRDYRSIGSGGDYAKPLLRSCATIAEAIEVAESSIREANKHKKSLSKGLNVYSLAAEGSAKEIKFDK